MTSGTLLNLRVGVIVAVSLGCMRGAHACDVALAGATRPLGKWHAARAGEGALSGAGASGCSGPDIAATAPKGALDVGGSLGGSAREAIDPAEFFDLLVKRYKGLHLYRDTVRMVHVTSRGGSEPSRIETEIGCEIHAGGLKVQTSAAQVRSGVGLALPMRQSPAAQAVHRGYDLWLAPHMALKFADEPLKDFRSGVDEGFTPTDAERIIIDDRDMLHVELRSGDGLSDDCSAKFDLFINPQTMLVERIDGEQRLPDGGSCSTSLHITPHDFQGGEPEPAPATR